MNKYEVNKTLDRLLKYYYIRAVRSKKPEDKDFTDIYNAIKTLKNKLK